MIKLLCSALELQGVKGLNVIRLGLSEKLLLEKAAKALSSGAVQQNSAIVSGL